MTNSLGSTHSGHLGWWLGLAVLVTLALADWFFGSVLRTLVRGQAEVTVFSEPAGARVFADTVELGVTPFTDASLLVGRYVLRVEHPYTLPHREVIVVERGESLKRTVALEAASGDLSVVSNPRGASVTIDGELQDGVTPLVIDGVPAGMHEVRVSLPLRKIVIEQVEVLPGTRAEFNAVLNGQPLGELLVTTQPSDALVELIAVDDGEPIAPVPAYSPGMTLPVRSYVVRVSQSGHEAQERTVKLQRGENRLEFELQAVTAELAVKVVPPDAQVRITNGGRTKKYSGPVQLPVGKVTVHAKRLGFRARSKTLNLTSAGATVELELPRFNVQVGRVFRDSLKSGGEGPELVVLAAGAFRMGDLSGDGSASARPAHNVQLSEPFALGVREVTNAEWQRQFDESGDNKPVVKVTHAQIEKYLSWLSRESGAQYRLPSEAQWEYAARAGSTAVYGATQSREEVCRWANVADAALKQRYTQWDTVPCNDGIQRLADAGSLAANAFGLYDMIGNASEWLADCWHDNFRGAPADGRVWGQRCGAWVARGGAWDNADDRIRVSHREQITREGGELGLRVARQL